MSEVMSQVWCKYVLSKHSFILTNWIKIESRCMFWLARYPSSGLVWRIWKGNIYSSNYWVEVSTLQQECHVMYISTCKKFCAPSKLISYKVKIASVLKWRIPIVLQSVDIFIYCMVLHNTVFFWGCWLDLFACDKYPYFSHMRFVLCIVWFSMV